MGMHPPTAVTSDAHPRTPWAHGVVPINLII